jgi:predicted nucleotidyltransferase component of viral defense system
VNKEIKNLPHSIYDRLRSKSRESGLPFERLIIEYANERFLYRLSKSDYKKEFVLKGGLVFIAWGTPLGRHTRDIDFRAYVSNDLNDITRIIKEVCTYPFEADGMEFNPDTLTAEVIMGSLDYVGIRLKLKGNLGDMTSTDMQIDINFTDEILPEAINVEYGTLLNMPAPSLIGYPQETVVAEKLHTLVFRGSFNSRRKDYYDMWFISNKFDIEGSSLKDAIIQTFRNRRTDIPNNLPAALSDGYAATNQVQWEAFLERFTPEDSEITNFINTMQCLREYVLPPLLAASEGDKFELFWDSTYRRWW